MKKKIFCFNNGGVYGMLHAVAMCEDGHPLAEHACSHEYYMPHDLGITSDWKHDRYNKHCGEGNWELEWVQNPRTHEGLQKAIALNKALVPSPEAHL